MQMRMWTMMTLVMMITFDLDVVVLARLVRLVLARLVHVDYYYYYLTTMMITIVEILENYFY